VAIEADTPISAERIHAAFDAVVEMKAYPRTRVFYLPSLPRNPMGKVLRQALRERVTAGLSPLT